jgi:hypothetical protein
MMSTIKHYSKSNLLVLDDALNFLQSLKGFQLHDVKINFHTSDGRQYFDFFYFLDEDAPLTGTATDTPEPGKISA